MGATPVESQPAEVGPLRGHAAREESDEGTLSLYSFLAVLVRHRRVLLGVPVAGAVILGVLGALTVQYNATAQFSPEQSGGRLGALSGLAAQFGFTLPVGGDDEALDFYVRLLDSKDLLSEVIADTFPATSGVDGVPDGGATLVELFGIEETDPVDALTSAVDVLRGRLSVERDLSAGIVTLTVRAGDPDLAESIAERLLEAVNDFNLRKRQRRATAEREFVEERLTQAEEALRAVEDSLQRFLSSNRSFENSPQLTFLYDRLRRDVELRQQVFTTLAQAHEQASIEEVRNTPVITIVDSPDGTARATGGVVSGVIRGIVLGALVGVAVAFIREYVVRSRERYPEDYAVFLAAKQSGTRT